MGLEIEAIHTKMQERYALAATGAGCCNGNACCASDYSADELARIPAASVLGLGRGNPVRAADLHPGETVVDLGSGGGIDVFLAASVVGAQGRAIGVDMTPAMVDRARDAARSPRAPNTSFVLAPIERIPLADNIADVVLSNCVINLSPDKPAVFAEAFRILKPGGRLAISDIVQERDLGKIEDDCGCVATAMVRAEYLNTIRHAGFGNFTSPKTGRGARGQTGWRHRRSHSSLENRTGGELVIRLSLAQALGEERQQHGCRCESASCADCCRSECQRR